MKLEVEEYIISPLICTFWTLYAVAVDEIIKVLKRKNLPTRINIEEMVVYLTY